MPFHRLVSLLVLCVLSLTHAGEADAQTTAEKASAELLFDEALSLMRNGSFAEACPKLESSQRIDPAVGTLLYLSECYERQGRTASAWVTFREAAALARSEGQLDRANVAERRADELQKELALVVLEITPEARQIPGLEVRCGSVSVDVSLGTISVPVDPGQVAVEASAPEHAPFTQNLEVDPKGRGTVVIPGLTRTASSSMAASPVAVGVVPAVSNAELVRGGPAAAPTTADSEARAFDAHLRPDDWGCDRDASARTGCITGHELVLTRAQAADTCTGDSGGAVLARAGKGWAVIAITSRAVSDSVLPCGDGGIYVRLAAHKQWLEKEFTKL